MSAVRQWWYVQAQAAADESDHKIIVRNLAFEASAKDVRTLMEAFGQVKTCRLPKKFDGSRRGFAFVEFTDKVHAKHAMQAVHGTHLYGRRLRLEFAKEEEGLDDLRAKASLQAPHASTKHDAAGSKKSKRAKVAET